MANALAESDVNEAHRQLLGEMAPVAHDLSEFTFGFALAIFRRYVGEELTMTLVAKVKDAPDIDELRFPFLVETPGLRTVKGDHPPDRRFRRSSIPRWPSFSPAIEIQNSSRGAGRAPTEGRALADDE